MGINASYLLNAPSWNGRLGRRLLDHLRVITIFRGAPAPIPSRPVSSCVTGNRDVIGKIQTLRTATTLSKTTNNCSKLKKSINNTANTKGVTYGFKKEKKNGLQLRILKICYNPTLTH